MVQSLTTSCTLEEFLALPETKPVSEYGDGVVTQKPMPQGRHSVLHRELSFALTTVFRRDNVAQVFPKLRCTFGGRSIVPDIVVFRRQRIPLSIDGEIAETFEIYPDWTIEILSTNQSHTRVVRNILHCKILGWLKV